MIYNKASVYTYIYILLSLFIHLTSIKIDDKDFDFIRKHKIRIKDIFNAGLEKYKTEMLSELYDLLAKKRKDVYTLEQKIYILEQENIYKSQKIYTLDDVLHDFQQSNRIAFSDNQNIAWLKPRVDRLRENGCAKTVNSVLEYCKNNFDKKLVGNDE